MSPTKSLQNSGDTSLDSELYLSVSLTNDNPRLLDPNQ